MPDTFPILEFDPDPQAVIEPSELDKKQDLPEHCVMCFFSEVVSNVSSERDATLITPFRSEMAEIPVHQIEHKGKKIAFFQAPVGAPLAAGHMEEAIARGASKFIACGSCGVLDSSIVDGGLVVPTSALRDEGTSYHYLPAARTVEPSPEAVTAIRATLDEQKIPYVTGATWTTDAFYRETRGRVAKRKAQGCITVEMEAAAFFAVAEFRGVQCGQILYGSDDVSGEEWNRRNLGSKIPVRETLFWLAMDACVKL